MRLRANRALAFVEAARKHHYEGRILIVTAGVSGAEAVRLLQAGVSGIVGVAASAPASFTENDGSVSVDRASEREGLETEPPQLTVTLVGKAVMTGPVLSLTVMVWLLVVLLPQASVAR